LMDLKVKLKLQTRSLIKSKYMSLFLFLDILNLASFEQGQ